MSAVLFTYPHYETRTKDESIYTPTLREALPLHKPVHFFRAQQGPVGVPMWMPDYNYATSLYGEGTFDKYAKWYSREAVFMDTCFERQGCYGIRLATDDAAYANIVIYCQVTTKALTQYEKDEYGNFILDTDGNKVPKLDASNNPITEPGYSLKWTASTIAQDVDPTFISVQTVSQPDGSTVQTFPIMAVRALYPGEYGDSLAFSLNFDPQKQDSSQMARVNSLMYTFTPLSKDYSEDTISPIRNIVNDPTIQISMKSSCIDKDLNKDYGVASVFYKQYWSQLYQQSKLPYSIHVYSNYFEAICTSVQAVETNHPVDDPFLLDIMTGRLASGEYLDHVVIEDDPADPNQIIISKNFIIYLKEGSDGDISDDAIEELMRQYLKAEVYPEIIDQARYPITHLYDTGYSLETKTSMIEFLGVRDDVKVVLSTQNVNNKSNTKDEDLSVGEALHSSALLQPESTVWGTECCRAEIYQQTANLADTTRYTGKLPFTLDILGKRCLTQSKTYMDGMPKGLPQSGVTIFDINTVNWVPYTPEHKQLAWDTGLNWAQYYDRKHIHYADMRTVYRYDTSVLTSAIFTDVLIYTKQIIRYNWAYHAGRELPPAQMFVLATKTTLADLQAMLNGIYGCSVRFYQTDEEADIGYIIHCECKLIGNPVDRIWVTDILCYRNGYNLEAA